MAEIICVQANAPTALGSCELKRNIVAVNALTQAPALSVKVNLACVCVSRSEANKTANCVLYDAVRRFYQGTLYLNEI
jgi:hypothetical protein